MERAVLFVLGMSLLATVPASSLSGQDTDTTETPTSPTQLTFDLGFVNAAGNTDVTTLSLGESFEYAVNAWELTQQGNLVYGRTDGVTTAEQFRTTGRVDYLMVPALSVFLGGAYERNRFAGIARRFEEFVGLSARLIDGASDKWSLEAGLSLNQQRSTTGVNRNFAGARGATVFRHHFTEASHLQQSVEVLPSLDTLDDTRVNSETALVAPLAGRIALKLSYVIRYDNVPEPGFEETDRIFTTGLQIVL